MFPSRARRALRAGAVLAVAALTASACSVGSIGSGSDSSGSGTTTITYLTGNDQTNVAFQTALIDGFMKANPDIKINLETQPGGTEGDNLTKTKLSTGEMDDVFNYNDGSLFQALNPDNTLTPLGDQPWVSQLTDQFKATVSTSKGLYGAPLGSSQAGPCSTTRRSTASSACRSPRTGRP